MTATNLPSDIRTWLAELPADTRAALAAELNPNPRAAAADALRTLRAGAAYPAAADDTTDTDRPSILGDGGDGGSRRERAASAIRGYFSRGDRAPSDPVSVIDALRAQGFDNISHDSTGQSFD